MHLFLFGCTLLGCGKEPIVVDTEGEIDHSAVLSQDGLISQIAAEESSGSLAGAEDKAVDLASKEEGEMAVKEAEHSLTKAQEPETLWIHICGEVLTPGVYELPGGSRIYDAIQAAGGLTSEGDGDYLNQASLLEDGMKITVPAFSQVREWEKEGETGIQAGTRTQSGTQKSEALGNQERMNTDTRIDLNTADEAALCTLPGIGASRAKSIIAYREENGPFLQIEDIMKVSGIKTAAFAKIKDYIRVS